MYEKDVGYLSLKLNYFKDQEVNSLTENIIKIPKKRIPLVIIFDQHSSIKELTPATVQNINSYILEEKLRFTIEELTNDILATYPGKETLIGSKTKKAVKNKIKQVMSKLKEQLLKFWRLLFLILYPCYNELKELIRY